MNISKENPDALQDLDVIKTTTRFSNPFDNDKYDELAILHPIIAGNVERNFIRINREFKENENGFKCKVLKELSVYNLDLPSKEKVETILDENVYIRNHMFSVNLEAYVNGEKIKFPLKLLSKRIKGAFFVPTKTPSMIIFTEEGYSCVIFTYNGNINFVGGYTETEVKYSLVKFVSSIEVSMVEIYGDCVVEIKDIRLQNRVITSKLCLRKIDLFHLGDFLHHIQFPFIYLPEDQDLITISPLICASPSIRVRIYSSGGIVGIGLKALYEVYIVCYIVIATISDFIRETEKTHNKRDIEIWKKQLRLEHERQEKSKSKKRAAKLLKWEEYRRSLDD